MEAQVGVFLDTHARVLDRETNIPEEKKRYYLSELINFAKQGSIRAIKSLTLYRLPLKISPEQLAKLNSLVAKDEKEKQRWSWFPNLSQEYLGDKLAPHPFADQLDNIFPEIQYATLVKSFEKDYEQKLLNNDQKKFESHQKAFVKLAEKGSLPAVSYLIERNGMFKLPPDTWKSLRRLSMQPDYAQKIDAIISGASHSS